jgi:Mg2+/Co2+ transporter CorB
VTLSLFLLCLCFCFSFFFSGSETAYTAASRPLLHEMAKKGSKRAKSANALLKTQEKLIGTLLFGNTLVNIAASSISTALLLEIFGQKGVAIATLGVSFFILIFCEIMPKMYALRNATPFALFITPFLSLLVRIFSPLVLFLNWIVRKAMYLLGMRSVESKEAQARTELRGAINLPKSLSIRQEQKMLNNVLDLSEVTVGDIMIHRSHIVTVNADTEIHELIKFAINAPFTRIPVWKDKPENIVGVLHVKALLRATSACHGNLTAFHIEDHLTAPWFILETTTLLNQLYSFRKRKEHFSIVIDEYGAIQGIVTLEDVLEEIVGDIEDETDSLTPQKQPVQPQKDGSLIIDGETSLRDLNRQFNWNLPDENASTLSGLIVYEAERIPQAGQAYSFYGFHFKILTVSHNHLDKIEVSPIVAAPGQENTETFS